MSTKTPPVAPPVRAMLQAMGARLRARRKALGVSAIAAAESAGISRVTWYRMEKGEPSVAGGTWASAAAVLGVTLMLGEQDADAPMRGGDGWLPARVRLEDYPQLRELAWHVHGAAELTPREALSIYERNARHLDESELEPGERALIEALDRLFAGTAADGDAEEMEHER